MVKIAIYAGNGEGEIGELARVEVNGELVLTTAQLAKFYDCPTVRISQNFLENKERFVEGKHFFKLVGEDLKKFKNELGKNEFVDDELGKNESVNGELPFVGSRVNVLYLWTKRGVARHSKMLNTRTAWEVFELLEDNYFSGGKIASKKSSGKIPKNELTPKEKVDRLIRLAKITKDAARRENLIANAEKIIVG